MQRSEFLMIAALVMAVAASFWSDTTEARLGGGRSMGAQRPSIAPRASTPQPTAPQSTAPSGAASQPVMPATPGATLPARPAVPAAAAPSGFSRWLGPIAGIAAGLGLAALLSHFGLSEGFASVLLIGLLAIAAVFVVRMLLARRSTPQNAYAGSAGPPSRSSYDAAAPRSWEPAPRLEPVIGSAMPPKSSGRSLPAGFDAATFVKHAKQQFVRLQAAHGAGDRKLLTEVLTPEMYAEIGRDLDTRFGRSGTEVVNVDAEVLEVETEGDRHWASVRFTGELREDDSPGTTHFDEVWNLTKPVDGSSGWLLAGIQQLA